ncbi:hypothetical protein ABIB94_003651 [Bradyrhizobium sp. JR7.2]
MIVSKHADALPPPLRGRHRPPSAAVLLVNAEAKLRLWERGSPGRGLSSWLALSLPLPSKGGGNERPVPASHANFPPKFTNDSNPILLCMGLFSTFLIGRSA